MNSQPFELIFKLHRGSIPESLHYGAVAVANAQGQLVAAWGDPHTLAYLRSSAKPFQAVPLLERGGREHYHLTDEEIAVMCASHSGTDAHVAAVRSIQAKCAVSEADLLCGVHPLSHQPTLEAMRQRGESLSPNRSNCSGKHSGMLALANMLAAPLEDYINPSHPIQKLILETYAGFCGLDPQQVVVGIDGCSAPNFAVPLLSSAAAFARLCAPDTPALGFPSNRVQACRAITHAMISHPEMVGGPASFDTHLLRVMSGRLVAKVGAEGFQGIGLMPGALYPGSPALGITYKISDGDLKSHTRPVGDSHGQVRPAVAVEILRQLGALQPSDLAALHEYGPTFPVYNWRGLLAGEGRPAFKLEIYQHLLAPQPGIAGY